MKAGAVILNNVDATNGAETMAKIGGKPWLVVWGSPHPNTFNDLFPKLQIGNSVTTRSYKQSVVGVLHEEFLGANVVMPHPSYYNLDNTVKVVLPCVNGVRYSPMASCEDALQRLCSPDDVLATFAGHDVEQFITDGALHLRALCLHGLRNGKKIIFMGEYICDLSYVCLSD